ncbi:hypothetical protein JL720_7360 [Aureococcus anophagefferens]|nr:hypothetical protein JL720_7360 [Aureococcus anophagefferens]
MAPKEDTVRVAVRIRPLNKIELNEKNAAIFEEASGNTVRELDEIEGTKPDRFYDFVYGDDSTNRQVYEDVAAPIVKLAVEGFNGTVFAYGQTSSGKTWSMIGNDENPGIMPQSIRGLFEDLGNREGIKEFLVRVSYMEIYNEEIKDLLGTAHPPGGPEDRRGPQPGLLRARPHGGGRHGRRVHQVDLGARREKARSYGFTEMNANSSRSHVVFKMMIETKIGHSPVCSSCMYLVDLAGSERQKKTAATGQRLKEGNAINKSLLALGAVISKLSEGKKGTGHIPYRDSKLTRMLSSALGGNSKTAMIAAISPAERNRDESQSTLRFASRAKRIVNCAKKNEIKDNESMMVRMTAELEDLKTKLKEMKERDLEANANLVEEKKKLDEDKAKVEEEGATFAKIVTLSAAAAKVKDVETSRKLQKNLTDFAKGRRRAQSVMIENTKLAADAGVLAAEEEAAEGGDDDEGHRRVSGVSIVGDDEEAETMSAAQLEAADVELKRTEAEAAAFREEKDAHAAPLNDLKLKKDTIVEETNLLQHQLMAAKASLLRAETEQDREHKLCKSFQQSYDANVAEIKKSKPAIEAWAREAAEARKRVEALDRELSSLRVEASSAHERLEHLTDEVRTQTAEVRGFSSAIRACEERANAAKNKIDTLKAAKHRISEELAELKDADAELADDLERKLKKQKTPRDATVNKMAQTRREMEHRTDEAETTVARCRDDEQKLKARVGDHDRDMTMAIRGSEAAVARLQQEIEDLETHVSREYHDEHEYDAVAAAAQRELDATDRRGAADREIDRLTHAAERAEATRARERAIERSEQATWDLATLEKQVAASHASFDHAAKEWAASKARIEDLGRREVDMQQRLNEALKAKSDALIAGGRAAEEHAKVSSAVAAIKAEVGVWHRRAAEAQEKTRSVEAQLKELQTHAPPAVDESERARLGDIDDADVEETRARADAAERDLAEVRENHKKRERASGDLAGRLAALDAAGRKADEDLTAKADGIRRLERAIRDAHGLAPRRGLGESGEPRQAEARADQKRRLDEAHAEADALAAELKACRRATARLVEETHDARRTVPNSTTGLGGPDQTSEFSSLVKSKRREERELDAEHRRKEAELLASRSNEDLRQEMETLGEALAGLRSQLALAAGDDCELEGDDGELDESKVLEKALAPLREKLDLTCHETKALQEEANRLRAELRDTVHLEAEIDALQDETSRVGAKRQAALAKLASSKQHIFALEEAKAAKERERTRAEAQLEAAELEASHQAEILKHEQDKAERWKEQTAESLRDAAAAEASKHAALAAIADLDRAEAERSARAAADAGVPDGDLELEAIKGDYHEAMEAWAASHDSLLVSKHARARTEREREANAAEKTELEAKWADEARARARELDALQKSLDEKRAELGRLRSTLGEFEARAAAPEAAPRRGAGGSRRSPRPWRAPRTSSTTRGAATSRTSARSTSSTGGPRPAPRATRL